MAFDISTAKPIKQSFDISSAKTVQQEPIDKYTGLEKFIVGATPIVTSIAGGIAGSPLGFGGIVAGGAAGAATGRLLADNLEEMFGGEERAAEDILKRAGKDALIDTAFTVGTFGVGKGVGMAIKTPVFKPIKDAIFKVAKPVKKAKTLQKVLERKSFDILSKENIVRTQVEQITKQTKSASKLGLKNINKGIAEISDNIDDLLKQYKPDIDSGMYQAREALNKGYTEILKTNGNLPMKIGGEIIENINKLPVDDMTKESLKSLINKNIAGTVTQADDSVVKELLKLGINPERAGVAAPVVQDILETTVSQADDIKRGIDGIIKGMIGNSTSKKYIAEVAGIQDDIIKAIGDATGDEYIKLSANWRRMMQVEKNINNALGAIGTGASEVVRGKDLVQTLSSSLKNIKPDDNIFDISTGFLGKINSQINLLESAGLNKLANTTKQGISELVGNIMTKNDYIKTEKILKTINTNMKAGQKLSINDIKKMFDLKNIGGIQKTFGEIIDKQGVIKGVEKGLATDKAIRQRALTQLASPELKGFSSFNDRYMPMILAMTATSVVPGVASEAKTAAGLYTLKKLAPTGAFYLSQAIEKLQEQALKKITIPKHKMIINKFFSGLINNIRNDEDF